MLGQPMTAGPFETSQRGAEILAAAHHPADRLSLIR
jgi:hypothetical protein